jgi:hypothetical protein
MMCTLAGGVGESMWGDALGEAVDDAEVLG